MPDHNEDAVSWNLSMTMPRTFYIAAGQLTTGFLSSDPLLGTTIRIG